MKPPAPRRGPAWLRRTSTFPVTASTNDVYALAAPPATWTTLASKTGRTVPSDSPSARRRTCCSRAKPGTSSRVHPPDLLVSTSAAAAPASPTSSAARSQACTGPSVAAGRRARACASARTRRRPLAVRHADRRQAAGGRREVTEALAEEHGAPVAVGHLLDVDQLEGVHGGSVSPITSACVAQPCPRHRSRPGPGTAPRLPPAGRMEDGVPKLVPPHVGAEGPRRGQLARRRGDVGAGRRGRRDRRPCRRTYGSRPGRWLRGVGAEGRASAEPVPRAVAGWWRRGRRRPRGRRGGAGGYGDMPAQRRCVARRLLTSRRRRVGSFQEMP